MTRENPLLAVWAQILSAPVIGTVGHHITSPGGPAHPRGHAPAWVTPHGCDVGALHAAHSAHLVHDRRGEDRECGIGAVRRPRAKRRAPRTNVIPMRRTA